LIDELMQNLVDAAYQTPIAMAAVFTPSGGDPVSIRVIPQHEFDDVTIGAEVGMRGTQKSFLIKQSDVADRPSRGDQLAIGSTTFFVVREADDITDVEWLIDVRA